MQCNSVKVIAVLPVHNEEKHIEHAIKSMFKSRQNTGSEDDTYQIASKIAEELNSLVDKAANLIRTAVDYKFILVSLFLKRLNDLRKDGNGIREG